MTNAADGFSDAERAECKRVLLWGLEEDLGKEGDVTSKTTIPADLKGSATMVARRAGVVAGLAALPMLARMQGFNVAIELLTADGPVESRQPLARYSGPMRGVLAIERLGLNLVGRLSGVATLTAEYVAAVHGTKAAIYDTRKTTPGLRRLEKYAVRVGGGRNHRIGLFDAVLIKDNHLAALATTSSDPVGDAVRAARASVPAGFVVEVEVDSLAQLDRALAAEPDIVLLDNMILETMREAVARRDARAPKVELEASGGVNLTTVRGIAETGVDRISVGALTHSAPTLDVALDYTAG